MAEKRRVYEEFLRRAPKPNDAYLENTSDNISDISDNLSELLPVILMYGVPIVLQAVKRYIEIFDNAAKVLSPDSPDLHEAFKRTAAAHNDLILEMRRDAFAMSAFVYRGKSRVLE